MIQFCQTKTRREIALSPPSLRWIWPFLFLMASVCVTFLLFVGPALGFVSVNVPQDDFAYLDLEKLIAQGLVKSDLWGTRPMSRIEMARLVHEARENWERLPREIRGNLIVIQGILARLEKRFREELNIIGFHGGVSTFLKPVERVSAYYRYQKDVYSSFNNEGIDYYDGGNAVVDLTMRAKIAGYLGLFAQPRLIYHENWEKSRDIKGNEVEETITDFQKCYAKLDINNIEFQYGRDSLWWSPSHHGALLISNNAEPFEMFKLSNPSPTVLPGAFEYLGLFKYNFIFTRLDSNRLDPRPGNERLFSDYDEPYLFGLHLDFKPTPWFEVGINQITVYGGKGKGHLSLSDHFHAMFFNNANSGTSSGNSEASIFFSYRWYNFHNFLPLAETLSFYGEWGAEDMAYPPDDRALQLGLLFGDFLKRQGRLQLRLEYANTTPHKKDKDMVWYSHGEHPATYEGRVFGHHVGSNAYDVFARLRILLNPRLEIGLQGDYERHGTSLPTEEQVLQGQADTTYWLSDSFNISGSFGLENVTNVNFVRDASENRSFLALQVQYYF
jgi:hypothetical protein